MNNVNIRADSVVILGNQQSRVGATGDATVQYGLVNMSQTRAAPPDAPQWARIINDCEVCIAL